MMRIYRLVVFMMLWPLTAQAQLQLARIFTDDMLLPRDKPACIWGLAGPGELVTVSFGYETKSTHARKDSTWCVYLTALKANPDPQVLFVCAGKDSLAVRNILVGDIWLCIGQSNMEWPVANEMNFKHELGDSDQPLLRFYNPDYAGKRVFGTPYTDSIVQLLVPERFYQGRWQVCDSISIKAMSAVAYYFGKAIVGQANVPVGLINLSIGGAPLETFIDKSALRTSRQFSAKIDGDWMMNDALPVWVRERGQQNVGALPHVASDENGKNHPYKPGFACSAGIEQLSPMAIAGVICYQGESNAQEMERVREYAALSRLMMKNYRKRWKSGRLPFYFVQLSSIDSVNYKSQLWPQFRDEQRKMLQLIPHSGMAVCSDIGSRDDVHPKNKKDVGERLARWALSAPYGYQLIPSGPLPHKVIYKGGKVILSFEFKADGLKTVDGSAVKGFSLDGINDVEAFLEDGCIVIYTRKKPDYIYYGWKPFSDGNLVNSEGLPASTFRISMSRF